MNNIVNYEIRKELYYKDTLILKYKISYPQISNSSFKLGQKAFNSFNKNNAIELKLYCEGKLFEEAKKTYEFNSSNGYPIMVYEVILNYEITYNNNNIVSLFSDEYIFSGGAHGNTIRRSQNWNLETFRQIPLEYFYSNDKYYVINILKEINRQIKQQIDAGNNYYFDNYCELVLETFKLENYYLYPNYITIFFQQYDIAPYSSGIPTFNVNY